ncbi:MAG: histidine phosphatase family protein [Pseudomonadota bacterium]
MRFSFSLAVAALVLLTTASWGRADPALLARLAEPRTHAVMRHALAPGSNDPAGFVLRDCTTQRNLDDNGRRQARRAGAMLRAAGVRIDRLWSSLYCRCLETARLMDLGPVVEQPFLNSFIRTPHRRVARTRELTEALDGLDPAETTLLVTHNVNAEAFTGTRPISGEIQVVRLGEDGGVTLLGRVEVPVF